MPDVIKDLRSVKEVDKPLLLYIYKETSLDMNSKQKTYLHEVYGYNAHQLSKTLNRLSSEGLIKFVDNKFLLNIDLTKKNVGETPPTVPFTSDAFLKKWDEYLMYRHLEHNRPLKSTFSQERVLKKLANDVGNNEELAIQVMDETMNNNWLGLIYGLKTLKDRSELSTGKKGRKTGTVSDLIRNSS